MKSFFKTFFAALAAVLIGGILVSIIGFVMFAGILGSMSSSSTYLIKEKTILKLDLNGALSERSDDNPLNSFTGNTSLGIDDILQAIEKAKDNDFVKGIYIKAGYTSGGVASLEPIRKALVKFKETGKFIVTYGDTYSQGAYYLASVSDKIILNPDGAVNFHGMSSIFVSVRGLYDKLGIKYQVFKVGTYKSAVEPFIQDKMSDANREQMTSYVNGLWSHILTGISESRNISVERLNALADKYLDFAPADSVLYYGMVDSLLYIPETENYLKQLTETEEKDKLHFASVENLRNIPDQHDKKRSKDKIAVLFAEGSIMAVNGNSLMSGETITAKQYVAELTKLQKDSTVKAVVFRVNSPGGSAYESEQIWNSVNELRKVKPVIVSMGNYAASGGYYISCAANAIVAEPTTLTGSIGVFGLIPQGEELAKTIGLAFDEVKTNKHSNFSGTDVSIPFLISALSRPLYEDESKMLQNYVERTYELFLTRCADGRGKTKEEINAIGQGRVWTGTQALEIGLVDKLGSLNDAIDIAAEKANITDYSIAKYPEKESFMTKLMKSTIDQSKMKAVRFFSDERDLNERLIINAITTTDIRQAVMTERIRF
ncbi:MAG: signal peptide peptidase SppA [Tannerella sp.]|jgi:protease-4|nr:signal peptide peptidase SppA [Tannerella sp.]